MTVPPRYPQHFRFLEGEPDWVDSPAWEGWDERCCGLACLRSLLAFHGLPVPSQACLLAEAIAAGAFTERGMLHSKLAQLAGAHGLRASAAQIADPAELFDLAAAGSPPIASVTHRFPQDGRTGGHLVIAAGWAHTPQQDDWAASQTPPGGRREVLFVDPSRWGASHSRVPLARFAASYGGRCVVAAVPAVSPRSVMDRFVEEEGRG